MITRFAPSPTGYLHFGNLRTALFNWLLAQNANGSMQLRIEDTDKQRNDERYVTALKEDLAWLGITWRGDADGNAFRQSTRQSDYIRLFESLKSSGHIYPCFCTPEMLAQQRTEQQAKGKPPKYDGRCATLRASAIRRLEQQGTAAAWRFCMPPAAIAYTDFVRGKIKFPANNFGDFVIRRTDGDFAFLFVNTVDDALCGVSIVLRGEDHIANTPRQLALLNALALPAPQYGHIPLIVNQRGQPLSKRNGLTPVRQWRQRGFLPIAVLNYLARIGHHYPPDSDGILLPLGELVRLFSMHRLSRAAAQYDEIQLRQQQKAAVLALSDGDFDTWLSNEQMDKALPNKAAFCQLIRDNVILPEDATAWRRVFLEPIPPFDAAAKAVITTTSAAFYQSAAKYANCPNWADFSQQVKQATKQNGKGLILPLRAALTGRIDGPAMPAIFAYLPADKRQKRLTAAAEAPQHRH